MPYVEYQLIKMWSAFVMDWPDHWGDDRNFQKIVYKSGDKSLVEKFLNQLQEQ